jgi:hypothetical protein
MNQEVFVEHLLPGRAVNGSSICDDSIQVEDDGVEM